MHLNLDPIRLFDAKFSNTFLTSKYMQPVDILCKPLLWGHMDKGGMVIMVTIANLKNKVNTKRMNWTFIQSDYDYHHPCWHIWGIQSTGLNMVHDPNYKTKTTHYYCSLSDLYYTTQRLWPSTWQKVAIDFKLKSIKNY